VIRGRFEKLPPVSGLMTLSILIIAVLMDHPDFAPITGVMQRRPDGLLLEFLRHPAGVLYTFPGHHHSLRMRASPLR